MQEEKTEIKAYCEECRKETKMRFVERENEYLVYECSVCDSVHEFSVQEVEKNTEEEIV